MDRDSEVRAALAAAQRAGMKLALKCRTVALGVIGLWFVVTSSSAIVTVYATILIGGFIVLGLLHHRLVGSRWDRWWLKYAFFAIDVLALTALTAFGPLSLRGDIPQIIAFRAYGPYYALMMLPLAALSLTPRLLLFTGATICVGWWAAFLWVVSGMERTLSWGDLPPTPDAEQYLSVFLDPDFIGVGNRVEETAFIMLTSILLAIAVGRARGVVLAFAAAERARRDLARTFGRYLPEQVAQALLANPDSLAPVTRDGTVLFLDIQGFTHFSESRAPQEVLATLHTFFDAATETIADHGGVVIDLIGDALLATFNIPLDQPDHAAMAIRSAHALERSADTLRFNGTRLGIRIGIATGPVAAGSVGGRRQTYTVYGDTVNLAQRLEQMNKQTGTRVLVSQATVAAAPTIAVRPVGDMAIKGRSATADVFALDMGAPAGSAVETDIPPEMRG